MPISCFPGVALIDIRPNSGGKMKSIVVTLIVSLLFSGTAFAAKSKKRIKRKPAYSQAAQVKASVPQSSVAGSITQVTVESNFGSGDFQGQNFDVFSIKPQINATIQDFALSASVPLTWASTNNTQDDSGFRSVGRPMLAAQKQVFKQAKLDIDAGSKLQLPLYSSSVDLAGYHRMWTITPYAQFKQYLSPKLDLLANAELRYHTEGKQSQVTLERAMEMQAQGGIEYRYDTKVTVGSYLKLLTSVGDHKLTYKAFGSTQTYDKAHRDRMTLGLYGNFKLNTTDVVSIRLSSALRDDNSLVNGIVGLDELEETSKLAASLNLTRRF